ncbi:MAG: hypothetical protein NZ521_02750 [Flammeovirgaceae bacterium]|nr:hypothetical protein [Flammeovirgaceae bacterium]MDW8287083.1 hypothetical protein [Flammeovirgaceae bacterium]
MNIADIEKRLVELKAKQSEIMKLKKDKRDLATLESVRKEMNDLKEKASKIYRGKK